MSASEVVKIENMSRMFGDVKKFFAFMRKTNRFPLRFPWKPGPGARPCFPGRSWKRC